MIKIRAWDPEAKVIRNYDELKALCLDILDGSDYVVEQCTGLKDMNGKEIYEGDIVRETYLPTGSIRHEAVVKYFPQFARFGIDDGNGYPLWGTNDSHDYEIIGNIHENPKMLKG